MAKPSKPDPLIGTTLGRYTIESRLGAGGMGAVYRAKETGMLRRTVALKVLPSRLAEEGEFVERFAREAQRASELRHANVVQVYDADEADGHYYMAMQLMDGGSLADLIGRHGALDPLVAARVVRDAARGLACAHKAGIVHRDIKPANIFLDDHGARLGDFGLVKALDGDDQPLTQTGMILGTPHYMAPEQCEGETDIDHRADLYALGLVLYHVLSGKIPAKGSTPLQIIRNRCMEDPQPLREVRPSIPPTLLTLVDELLIRDRRRRLGDAAELARRLDHFMGDAAGDAATLAPDSAVAHPGVQVGSPSDLETIDLPARSGVAASTGLGSGEAPPPPPPGGAAPTTPGAAGVVASSGGATAAAGSGTLGAAASADALTRPSQRPPSTQSRPPSNKGKVALYACLAMFVGLVVLPAGCIVVMVALSPANVQQVSNGAPSREPADLQAFLFGLAALGDRPHVVVEMGEVKIAEQVDLDRGDGSLDADGLVLSFGPFSSEEFGNRWSLDLVFTAPSGEFRAEGSLSNTLGAVPGLTVVSSELREQALYVSGHFNEGSDRYPFSVRVAADPPPESPSGDGTSPRPVVPTSQPVDLAQARALRQRLEMDFMEDEMGIGAFLTPCFDGAQAGVLAAEEPQSGVFCIAEVIGPTRVLVRVQGISVDGPLGCDMLTLAIDVGDLHDPRLTPRPLSLTCYADGEVLDSYRTADVHAYQLHDNPALLVNLGPGSGALDDQLVIFLE